MHNSELLEECELFKIQKIDDYPQQIGHLISLMNYARITTFDAVEGLSISELDFLIDEKANSIGMLLLHIASVEEIYRVYTLEGRKTTDAESKKLEAALELGDLGREKIKDNSLDYYLDNLSRVRKKSLEGLKNVEDSWLYEETDFWDNKMANNYFKWFHVLEDEINHRGQIRFIKKRI